MSEPTADPASPASGAPFSVPITVRGYETDTQGHLNQSVYLQYGEHARWALLAAAGIRQQDLVGQGVGPVALETTIRFLRELRAGDETVMSCRFEWGTGKTFRITQILTKADGTVAAEITALGGMLDLRERRMIQDPRGFLRKLATDPDVLDR
ncbi:thioesterase family protein [Streptomyces sp. TS71-3]|uniref:acyl-CoA thioesterase n=1 Tax=Streptomyces sp. TS71-3 TaxID=2733862 RepID=UPI001B011F01|nr:acyl-CoA thioesterase [Streptomyces sp. TS71-3]GHJ41113.1 thioesterase [Streptomyces sp. TS71-3]